MIPNNPLYKYAHRFVRLSPREHNRKIGTPYICKKRQLMCVCVCDQPAPSFGSAPPIKLRRKSNQILPSPHARMRSARAPYISTAPTAQGKLQNALSTNVTTRQALIIDPTPSSQPLDVLGRVWQNITGLRGAQHAPAAIYQRDGT